MIRAGVVALMCAIVLSGLVRWRSIGSMRSDSVLLSPTQRVLVATYYLRALAVTAALCLLASGLAMAALDALGVRS